MANNTRVIMALLNKYDEVVCELESAGAFFYKPADGIYHLGYLMAGDEFYVAEVEVDENNKVVDIL